MSEQGKGLSWELYGSINLAPAAAGNECSSLGPAAAQPAGQKRRQLCTSSALDHKHEGGGPRGPCRAPKRARCTEDSAAEPWRRAPTLSAPGPTVAAQGRCKLAAFCTYAGQPGPQALDMALLSLGGRLAPSEEEPEAEGSSSTSSSYCSPGDPQQAGVPASHRSQQSDPGLAQALASILVAAASKGSPPAGAFPVRAWGPSPHMTLCELCAAISSLPFPLSHACMGLEVGVWAEALAAIPHSMAGRESTPSEGPVSASAGAARSSS